jgi:hypothetical protein
MTMPLAELRNPMTAAIKVVEAATKVLALVTAYAVTLGLVFNLAFFSGAHSQWLGLLSFNDYIGTTIFMLGSLLLFVPPLFMAILISMALFKAKKKIARVPTEFGRWYFRVFCVLGDGRCLESRPRLLLGVRFLRDCAAYDERSR